MSGGAGGGDASEGPTAPRPTYRRWLWGLYLLLAVLLAAFGAVYWVGSRVIPLKEEQRFGRAQVRLLSLCQARFDERLANASYILNWVVARQPNPLVDGILSELPQPHALRRYDAEDRAVDTRGFADLIPPADTVRVLLDASRRRRQGEELAEAELLDGGPAGGRMLIFTRPLWKETRGAEPTYEGTWCLFAAVDRWAGDVFEKPLFNASYAFLLGFQESRGVASRPTLLYHSEHAQYDEPSTRLAHNLFDALKPELARLDEVGKTYATVTVPDPEGRLRQEIVAFSRAVIGSRRWLFGIATPREEVLEISVEQRNTLVVLGTLVLAAVLTALGLWTLQRQQSSRAIESVESSYRNLFVENPTAMFVLDERRLVADCNAGAAQLLAQPVSWLRGKPLDEWVEGADPRQWCDGADDTTTRRRDVRWTRRADGVPLRVELWCRRIGSRWVLMVSDVEQRRDLELQLSRTRRMESVAALASSLAHDFNNILGQLQILVSNLRTDFEASSRPYQDLLFIEGKIEDAARLVGEILAVRENVLAPTPVRLLGVLQEFAQGLRRVLPKDTTLEITIAPDLPAVGLTAHALRRLLDNLCRNAQDAMPAGGRLTLRAATVERQDEGEDAPVRPGLYAVVEVGDTGAGMSDAVQERLFQPFFTTKERGGTGLGLWTVFNIVRRAGGDVSVRSREGRGTTVVLHLPSAAPANDTAGDSAYEIEGPAGA